MSSYAIYLLTFISLLSLMKIRTYCLGSEINDTHKMTSAALNHSNYLLALIIQHLSESISNQQVAPGLSSFRLMTALQLYKKLVISTNDRQVNQPPPTTPHLVLKHDSG